jgi:glycosyltransferase involved in cell wall biosynthesis
MKIVLLIPAYNPEHKLVTILKELPDQAFYHILIVNDGSHESYKKVFDNLSKINNLTLLEHEKNKGKGAALKSGFSHIVRKIKECDAVITADADGQHSSKDILAMCDAVSENTGRVIIGSRTFDRDVPFRSRLGNRMTRMIMKLFFKIDLSDTQSGLRAIPYALQEKLLKIRFNRYEFETEMLMVARQNNYDFEEIQIDTIYENNNAVSSFNPVVDSAKIYFVMFRYILASLVTAAIDYAVFFATYSVFQKIFLCTYAARFVALFINFVLLKQFVFHSKGKLTKIIFKYFSLVILSGFISSTVTQFFAVQMGLNIGLSKVSAELLLYFAVFVVQKEFVFKPQGKSK